MLTDPVLRQAEGLALLAQQASQEAYARAYSDAFLVISALAAFAFAVLLLQMAWALLREMRRTPEPTPA